MKTCFSEGKLMKQFGNPPPSKRIPPLSTNPLNPSNFFMIPIFVRFLKTILGGLETMKIINYCSVVSKMSGLVKDKQLNKGNPSIYLGVISFYKMY